MQTNTPATRKPNGVPLPDDLRAKLIFLVREVGENAARARVGLSTNTFARALAGLTVYKGTIAIVREALERGGSQS
jgi:hypothetical protein